ncbi:MAG: hypothetical protein ABEJ61_01030 [Haloferacaceae archaeon]
MDERRLARFVEFLVIGIGMGVVEDVVAIAVTTDAAITPATIGVVVLVAFPFAFLSELVVDHPAFEYFERLVESAFASAR